MHPNNVCIVGNNSFQFFKEASSALQPFFCFLVKQRSDGSAGSEKKKENMVKENRQEVFIAIPAKVKAIG